MKEWYIVFQGQRVGPLSIEMLPNYGLNPKSMVWCEGMSDWTEASQVPPLSSLLQYGQQMPAPNMSQNQYGQQASAPNMGQNQYGQQAPAPNMGQNQYGQQPQAPNMDQNQYDQGQPGGYGGQQYGGQGQYGNQYGQGQPGGYGGQQYPPQNPYDAQGQYGQQPMYGQGGYPGQNNMPSMEEIKNKKTLAGVMAILFGSLGVQYFILGRVAGGLLTILLTAVTCGLWSILTFIQGIMMLTMSPQDFYQKYMATTKTLPLF